MKELRPERKNRKVIIRENIGTKEKKINVKKIADKIEEGVNK